MVDEKLKKKEDEIENEYIARIYRNRIEYGLNNSMCKDIINKELGYEKAESTYRGIAKIWNECSEYMIDKQSNSSELEELEVKRKEIEKERIKLRTEKLEYNKLLREESREELWWEYLDNSIKNMTPIEIPKNNDNIIEKIIKDGLLVISDCHYGRQCIIKGLDGEIISEYNINIFKSRMWDLLNQVKECCKERNIKHLNVLNNGDFIDGLLRISQLQSLQMGVIDSSLEYGEFMSVWLNELSKIVNIDYYQTNGNHDEIRILTGKKGDFACENVGKIIIKIISLRLENNNKINIHNSNNDFAYINILGTNVLGYHGENKNLINSIKFFRSLYKKNIDILIGGHLHSQSLETESSGLLGDCQCIRTSGICGIDDYSVKLQKSAKAGASMFIFKEGKGKTSQEDFWLN